MNQLQLFPKDDYIEGDVDVDGWKILKNLNNLSMKIRGRGNSTWGHPKKTFSNEII